VALESGSLGKALRATMSVPAVFTPVEYNGQLLVDGGILDNLPVKEAKAMGADVVIAVNIMAPSQNSDDIGSLISQTLDTVTANNVTPSAALADILVEPSLVELGLYKWDAVDRYVAAGYQAAERQKGILLKYSLDDAEWKQYLQERQKRCLTNLLVPQGIEVLGTTAINKKTIEKCLQPYIGKPVNVERLEKDLTALMGSGLYQNLSYQFVRYNGEPVLAITVQEKNYGPPFISFSTQSGFEHDNNKIETAVRLTSFNDIGPGSEIRIDLGIGTEPKMLFEIYQPLRDSKWFLAPSIYGKKEKSSLFEAGDRVADYQISNYGIACDLGYAFNKFSEGRLGYRNGYQDTHVKVGSSLGADYDGSVQAVYLKWKSNSGNDAFFPRSGLNIDSSVDWYIKAPDDGSNDFGLIENKVRWNIPVGRNDSFFLSLAGGSSLQGDLPLPQQFKLGGLFRLGAYSSDEFRGDNYILDNIGFFKSIAKMPTGSNIYLGVWMENGGVYENWSDLKIKTDLSFGIISSTILGPVFLSASFGEDSNTAYYLGLGYLF
jgi:NTE family protein